METAPVALTQLSVTKLYSGSLEGEEQASLVARISERVTGLRARVGDQAKAGQVIVELDKSGTSSQFFQAEANYRNAEKTLQRMKSLYAEGAISAQNLDGTQTAYDVAKANFDAARSAVEMTTPIAGSVTAVNVSLGDLTTPGGVLATVANITRLKVTFNLSETDAPNVAVDQKIMVYSETHPEGKMAGRIVQLSKSADIRSRSFEIKGLFPNTPDHWFRPGMFVKVDLEISAHRKTTVVPVEAIQSDGSTDRVFVIKNGRAIRRDVTLGMSDGSRTEILTGLSERDTVATVGLNNLTDGMEVSTTAH